MDITRVGGREEVLSHLIELRVSGSQPPDGVGEGGEEEAHTGPGGGEEGEDEAKTAPHLLLSVFLEVALSLTGASRRPCGPVLVTSIQSFFFSPYLTWRFL